MINGCASAAAPAAGHRGEYPESQWIEEAISHLAAGLRILLSLEEESQGLFKRSNEMGAEAKEVSGTERFDVHVVENYTDDTGAERSNWVRVGVGFGHKDGKGLNIELRALPVSGKLVIRLHEPKSPPRDG